jgi:hypothetical protein
MSGTVFFLIHINLEVIAHDTFPSSAQLTLAHPITFDIKWVREHGKAMFGRAAAPVDAGYDMSDVEDNTETSTSFSR